ncbi:MAG: nucleotide exchange factor GrpE [Verrucomicrobia bacterium]|nr:nucleotide exchange factor GrpE [Verrucomicrobiota bacterium]
MSKHKHDEPATSPEVKPETAPAAPAAPSPAPPLTEAEWADLTARADKAQQWYDQLLRTAADLENYRKRAARERADAVKFANESLLQKLVPVLDNFDMAIAASNGQNTTLQSLQAGVAMIHQQLKSALTEAGLEEIDAARKPFDPNLHEAVMQEESAEVAEGHVLRQMRRGYKLRDRLLRPATVVVAKPPAQP